MCVLGAVPSSCMCSVHNRFLNSADPRCCGESANSINSMSTANSTPSDPLAPRSPPPRAASIVEDPLFLVEGFGSGLCFGHVVEASHQRNSFFRALDAPEIAPGDGRASSASFGTLGKPRSERHGRWPTQLKIRLVTGRLRFCNLCQHHEEIGRETLTTMTDRHTDKIPGQTTETSAKTDFTTHDRRTAWDPGQKQKGCTG